MADKPNFDDIKNDADEIYGLYTANFAGKPRATRDLALLGQLIDRLAGVVERTRTLMNGDRDSATLAFLETATENLERYEAERAAIREAQADPLAVEGAHLAHRANRVFDAYRRHFAGQNRGTRDRMLLHEMVQELETIQGQMRDLLNRGAQGTRGDLETVAAQLQMYREELTNVARAQTVGSQDEVASRLATLANAQFELYQKHFAGKSRLSRRPGLIERMIANLEEYHAEMRELADDGYASEANRKNMGAVLQNLEMYRTELQQIRQARNEASVSDLAGALGGAANDVFGEYRDHFAGQNRATRDLERMGLLCDQLRDVALQMREIADEIDLEVNRKNLAIVEERWTTYELEYRRIEEAKGST